MFVSFSLQPGWLAIILACVSGLLQGCGQSASVSSASTVQQGQATSQSELAGTWISPCFAFLSNEYARATYTIQSTGKLEVLNQIYFDPFCQYLDETQRLTGMVSYGTPVSVPMGAKAIDFVIDGQSTIRSIYQIINGSLCFGSQSSPTVEGRPSQITCSKPFSRL